ncbi:hypothetical protein [Dactylosporangium sp. NPDC000521]|uniref:hypothetical protein n=1 Tax=Dactylosporangium sp. NPDC000521 TaxID=3363975 RepID=UPI0036BCBCA8
MPARSQLEAAVIVNVGGAVVEVSKAGAADFTEWHDSQRERRVAGVSGVDFDRWALIGLRFTGLIKVREFVDGDQPMNMLRGQA